MSTTFEQAKAAKENLIKGPFAQYFNFVAGKAPDLVNGAGLSKKGDNWYVKVNLLRKPSPEESKQLPKKFDGVKIKYDITGMPVAG